MAKTYKKNKNKDWDKFDSKRSKSQKKKYKRERTDYTKDYNSK